MVSRLLRTLAAAGALALAACASQPKPEPVWTAPSEAETASELDRKMTEAAKSFVKLKKNGVWMFCKRYKKIGSGIPTLECLTEAELRQQVMDMEEYRLRQRWAAKCPHGPQGCQSG